MYRIFEMVCLFLCTVKPVIPEMEWKHVTGTWRVPISGQKDLYQLLRLPREGNFHLKDKCQGGLIHWLRNGL
jgi:hypothetical protein